MSSSGNVLRGTVKDWTPPALLRLARRFREGEPVPSVSSAAQKKKRSTGIEYGPEYYDESFDDQERWKQPYWQMQWYGSWAVLADRVLRADDPRVLDMGCGAGHLGRLLCDRGLKHFVGFDFSPKRLAAAQELVPEYRFEVADAYKTDLFETVDYNIVTCCEFLEHLDGDLATLDRVRSGTRVLGTVPNYDAIAHLRYFGSEDEVMDRYASRFVDLTVSPVHNTGAGIEYLLDGHLR